VSWFATNFIISSFLLPPLNLLVLSIAGTLLLRRRPRLGRGLIALSLALLYVLSTPFCAERLLGMLERHAGPAKLERKAGAIVVLGGGTYYDAPEYGGDTVSILALERLRYGARLYRKTGKPLLVTGGSPDGGIAEGTLMKETLEQDFGVPVRWAETASLTTHENAMFSARILRQSGVDTIYLVTQAWHMPRAQREFERAGLKVIPAGTGFTTHKEVRAMDFIPKAKDLLKSYYAMHEAIGLVWYLLY
jgi:uncharacterized SAM-binding protein YcdF (DUF218 family)